MTHIKKTSLVLILATVILLQGCAAVIASQLGYMEANTKYTKLYDEYEAGQASAGQPVKEYKEWLKDQPLTSNEIKVFRYRGVIFPEDARGIRERRAMEKAGE